MLAQRPMKRNCFNTAAPRLNNFELKFRQPLADRIYNSGSALAVDRIIVSVKPALRKGVSSHRLKDRIGNIIAIKSIRMKSE
jgi:hypothetical protein